jgi:hypothetical protein
MNTKRSFLPLVALLATSCVVPPSCVDQAFDYPPPRHDHFATVTTYADPVDEAPDCRLPSGTCTWSGGGTGLRPSEWYQRTAGMSVDAGGRMSVRNLGDYKSCLRVSPADLDAVSSRWRPILEHSPKDKTQFRFMANPEVFTDEWRPDGPLVEVSFGSPAGESVGLMWDGRTSLPASLDTAVMATLELFCSSSRRADKYLLRDLPQQVARRLECHGEG